MAEPFQTWASLAGRAGRLAADLPPLPSFAAVLAGDRERWFRELGYTFWNRELADALAVRLRRASSRRWVEVAAGTGRLAAELARRGIAVAATDDHSQAPGRVRSYQRPLEYGAWVERLSAREAVARLHPEGVLAAWPPVGAGIVPDLLGGSVPGSESLSMLLCIGEPGGATEAPSGPEEMPPGWDVESWPECEQYLVGFNDPPPGAGWRSGARLLVYRRRV